MSNVLVTGSNGQLGSELRTLIHHELQGKVETLLPKINGTEVKTSANMNYYFTDKNELDITDMKKVKEFCKNNKITHIINCAAYTAVDKAEEDKALADLINHIAVKNLAQVSKELNISLTHISTDYVFNGESFKPYNEDDITNPQGVYGQTKLDGENAMIEINPKKSIIIRTSWIYSSFGANFVKTMLRLGKEKEELGVIFDQIGTPTYAADLAKTILDIIPKIKNKKAEIYHYSNEGAISWYDFAKEIMKMAKLDCDINPIETFQYPTPAKRPHYSLLNKSKIKEEFNLVIPYWKDSLDECLKKMGERK